MAQSNFERMIQLVTEAFDTKNDPDQLDVDQGVIARLQQIHPATLSEHSDEDGPVAWILLIPTTIELMKRFCKEEITEQGLYDLTQRGMAYEAIYLCSATVLQEYRGQGLAKQMTLDAINEIRKQYQIRALFVWPFSEEGKALAESVARTAGLPLLQRSSEF